MCMPLKIELTKKMTSSEFRDSADNSSLLPSLRHPGGRKGNLLGEGVGRGRCVGLQYLAFMKEVMLCIRGKRNMAINIVRKNCL